MNTTNGSLTSQALLNCLLTHPANTVLETKKRTHQWATETSAAHLVELPGMEWAVLNDDSTSYGKSNPREYTVTMFDSKDHARNWYDAIAETIETETVEA